METLKTALVVVLLLAVLYGVFVVLNKPDHSQPTDLAWQHMATAPPQVEFGDPAVEPTTVFPPMVTAPPEMKRSITPVADDAGVTDTPVGTSNLSVSINDRGAIERDEDDSLIPAYPVPEPKGPTPAFDSRAAGATHDDLSLAERTSAPYSIPRLEEGNPSRQSSVYESAVPESRSPATPAADGRGGPPAFNEAWQMAMDQLNHQQWADALRTLSMFYDRPEVVGKDRQRLVDLLDPLAGKVVYSTEHLLEPPYQVRAGETLLEIAQRYQVPATLLKKINGITDPRNLPPGSVLKVVRGPFRAEITLAKDELVLFLGDYYAGRFAISIGNDPVPEPAEYVVVGKQEGREYFAPDGSRIPPLAHGNPYGRWWIDLGGDVCIHASAETTPTHGGLGCISLTSNDAADVFSILSIGSQVLIR